LNSIAFIGAGRLGTALATALSRQGAQVTAVASRTRASAQRVAERVDGCRAVEMQQAAEADLVFLTVPDDEIGPLAARLAWRTGQRVVHCSGATEISVLAPAARQGALTGGFHPLQIFSDPQRAVGLLAGSTAAIEGPPALEAELRELSSLLGMRALVLPAGARALYHGSANHAASFLLSMLQEAVDVWRSFGIAPDDALHALLPLAQGTLAAAASRGLAGAQAGAVSRGDAGVVARHLAALDGLGGEHGAFYRTMTRRQLRLARDGGRLSDAQLAQLQALVDR
jgi:predicted short-subunit dehydrogenase-like oxidoreductase (DUF2520 family)